MTTFATRRSRAAVETAKHRSRRGGRNRSV